MSWLVAKIKQIPFPTWDILPKKEVDVDLRLCGVKLVVPLALSVCWRSNNSVDELHNQKDKTSLLSWTFRYWILQNVSIWLITSEFKHELISS